MSFERSRTRLAGTADKSLRLAGASAIKTSPEGDRSHTTHSRYRRSQPISEYAMRTCRIADAESASDTTLLLLAPWPESVWAFRRIWRQVAGLGRVVAIDLPGSDIPTSRVQN